MLETRLMKELNWYYAKGEVSVEQYIEEIQKYTSIDAFYRSAIDWICDGDSDGFKQQYLESSSKRPINLSKLGSISNDFQLSVHLLI